MTYLEKYQAWLNFDGLAPELSEELASIREDDAAIKERFLTDLEFGTAGLRGIIGAGTDRMNRYTACRATQGICEYIKKQGKQNEGVVIAYDSRHKSAYFSLESAKVLAANGIKAYLFDALRPTPELSFAIRHLGCAAGINITASHNPKEYNGYKAYGADGGQLANDFADAVIEEIEQIGYFEGIMTMDEAEAIRKGLLVYIGEEVDNAFLENVFAQRIHPDAAKNAPDFKVVYTPFHGAGNKSVQKILNMSGFRNVLVVKEQEEPDGDFPTVISPNPENREGFTLAMKLAKENGVDLIIGTDPDCDRVGVVVKTKDDYVVLSGNQTGALLGDYILSQTAAQGKMPAHPFVVKTVVTSEMIRKIAAAYHVEVMEVLTGFKYIAEQIKQYDDSGEKSYMFGFEESFGYLVGTYARDKDAVVASMLIAEMAAWYSAQGMTLYDALTALYEKYGYYADGVKNIYRYGISGVSEIKEMMEQIRTDIPKSVGGLSVLAYRDYSVNKRVELAGGKESTLDLPKSNVLYLELEGGAFVALRPSGTEPKFKIYFGASDSKESGANAKMQAMMDDLMARFE